MKNYGKAKIIIMVISFVESLGRKVHGFIFTTMSLTNIFLQTIYWIVAAPLKGKFINRKNLFEQMAQQ